MHQINLAQLAKHDLIDVRSPAEFAQDHIPGALNLPVLFDQQREQVGTLWKTEPFAAKRLGAQYVTANIAKSLRDSQIANQPQNWAPLIYCARGGLRSAAMEGVMQKIGWKPKVLVGGYKIYRHLIIEQTNTLPEKFSYIVVGGKTGVGKTEVLHALRLQGAQVLDLEDLAEHRGSVFGAQPVAQPSQQKFETNLVWQLYQFNPNLPVFVEAESAKIGRCSVPKQLLQKMRTSKLLLLEAQMPERIKIVARNYQPYIVDQANFTHVLSKLSKFLGEKKISALIDFHRNGQFFELIEQLLIYYDQGYLHSLKTIYGKCPVLTSYQRSADSEQEVQLIATQALAASQAISSLASDVSINR